MKVPLAKICSDYHRLRGALAVATDTPRQALAKDTLFIIHK